MFYLNYNDFIDPFSSRTSLTKLRLYPRYNYYLNLKKLSLYCHVGIGISLIDVKIDILDNAINYNGDISELKEVTYKNLLFRTGFGLKYKICEWAGFDGEIGIGGPLFTLGGYIRLKK